VQVFNSGSFFVYFVHSYQGDDDDDNDNDNDNNNNNNKPGFPLKSDCRATGRGDILVLTEKPSWKIQRDIRIKVIIMQQFINRRKKWITSNLHRNEVNKLGYFPAYYLHQIKKNIPKSVEKYSV